MNSKQKKSFATDGKSSTSQNTVPIKSRSVSCTGAITADSGLAIAADLLSMDAASQTPISLVISSCGGDVAYGLAIIDIIRHIRSPVATFALGLAASMAAVILACGANGCRYAFRHTRILLHPVHAKIAGEIDDVTLQYGLQISFAKEIEGLLVEATKRSCSEVQTALRNKKYMTASEALEMGIIDHIIGDHTS